MASKKIIDQVQEMAEEELVELEAVVKEKLIALKLEKNKDMLKQISIGKFVLYSKNRNKRSTGIVDMITSDFIGLKPVGGEGKNRRIPYEQVIEVSDQLVDTWTE
jgi:hypothetical protein